MEFCIKINDAPSGNFEIILNKILQTQIQTMALIDEVKQQLADVKAQATDLQASLDAEQEQIAALIATNAQVVTDLNAQITTLTEQLAGSANPTQLQEVIDGIAAIRDSLTTTKADLEDTV